jgi:large subunit ribosomal protein L3
MVTAILGKKIGMTQIFDADGTRIPVTVVQAGPCTVLQVKTSDGADGYDALQLGFDDVKPHRTTIPQIGHARKAQTSPKRFIREIRLDKPTDESVGDTVTVDIFTEQKIKYVDVIGTTKGKGFQGPMKRHGFGGFPASHGTERKHRAPGSIGGHSSNLGSSGGIRKGKKMAGQMGNVRQTVQSHALVEVDPEHNMLLIAGSVPGPKNGYVIVSKAKFRS